MIGETTETLEKHAKSERMGKKHKLANASSSSASSNDGLLRSESTCTHELIPSRFKRCAYQTTAKPHITDLSVKCNRLRTHSLRHYRGDECAVIDWRRWIGTEKKSLLAYQTYHRKQQKLHTSLWIPNVTGDKFIERKSMIPLRQLLLDFERLSPKRWTSRVNLGFGLTWNLRCSEPEKRYSFWTNHHWKEFHVKGCSFKKVSKAGLKTMGVGLLNVWRPHQLEATHLYVGCYVIQL